MADYFNDGYFPPGYFPPGYFEGGEQSPGAMSASVTGAGGASGVLIVAQATETGRGGSSSGNGYRGRRWWEDDSYRTQRKARQWTKEELDGMIDAAFFEAGVSWTAPLTVSDRAVIRRYVEARSHEMNTLLPAAADVTGAIGRREAVNADLRANDEEDTLLLLAA